MSEAEGRQHGLVLASGDVREVVRPLLLYPAVSLVVGAVIFIAAGMSGEDWSSAALVLVALPAFGTLPAVITSIWWAWLPGRVSYVCQSSHLVVMRGAQIVADVDLLSVEGVFVSGRMTWWEFFFGTVIFGGFPRVGYREQGRSTATFLPEVLLWGKPSADRFERRLNDMVRAERPGGLRRDAL